jgi:hypothetical protein
VTCSITPWSTRPDRLGRVRDARLVPDPAHLDAHDRPTYRLDGLVVSRPFDGYRLGYGRTVHAPRLLAAAFAIVRRRQHNVRWADIAHVDGTIVLTVTADRLPANSSTE